MSLNCFPLLVSAERLEAAALNNQPAQAHTHKQAKHPWNTQHTSLGTWSRHTLGPAGPPPKLRDGGIRTGIMYEASCKDPGIMMAWFRFPKYLTSGFLFRVLEPSCKLFPLPGISSIDRSS